MKRLLTDNRFLAVVLLILFIPIHLFALGEIPAGLNLDEVGMAYDAWCLANYGVDRYLKPFPVYLTNYGGGQSAMYAWLAAGLIALTGSASSLVLRLPAMAFGLMAMAFGALAVHEIMGKKHPKAWFAFGLFYLVCPYFTMAARFGLDCNLMLGMSTAFLYAVIRAQKRGRARDYALAGVAGGLTLYTYAVSYIPMVLFLLFSLGYLARVKRLKWKNALAAAVPLALIGWPLVAVQVINLFDLPEVTLFGTFTLTKLPNYRTDELGFGNLLGGLIGAVRSTLTHDVYPHSAPFQFWTMYPISVPLIAIGAVALLVRFVRSFRSRTPDAAAFVLLWGVAMLCVGALFQKGWPAPNVNQMNGIFFAAATCAVLGAFTALDWLRGRLRQVAACAVAAAYAVCGALFFQWYFLGHEHEQMFEDPLAEAIAFVEQNEALEGRTIYYRNFYTYYLYAAQISPYEYNLPEAGMSGNERIHCDPDDFTPPFDEEGVYIMGVEYDGQPFLDAGFQEITIAGGKVYLPADAGVEPPAEP